MTVYYVDMAVGDDANLGTSEGAGNAWKTLNYAESQVVSGDYVYVKASAPYTETLTVLVSNSAFVENIIFEGYETTPGDGGQVTIDGESTRSLGLTDNNFLRNNRGFFNFKFINHTSAGVGNYRGGYWIMANCEASNNTFQGLDIGGAALLIHNMVDSNQTGMSGGYGNLNNSVLNSSNGGGSLGTVSAHCLYAKNNQNETTVVSVNLGGLICNNITVDHIPGANSDASSAFLGVQAVHYDGLVLENGLQACDAGGTTDGKKYRLSHSLCLGQTSSPTLDWLAFWGDNYDNDGTTPDYVDQDGGDYRPAATSALVGFAMQPRAT